MAPGISLEIERLTLSLASENLLDYNFTAKEGNTAKSDKIFMSLLSYDFPVVLGSATNSFLRPSMYLRTIPGQSNQVGFYTLLNTDGYYGQVGYNNFYGYALGGGYTFFKRVTIGALIEIGSGASLQKETSFELMASYFLGTPEERHKMVGNDIEADEKNALEKIEEKQKEEKAEEQNIDEELEMENAIVVDEQMEKEKEDAEKQKADSIEKTRLSEAAALKKEQQRIIDAAAEARAAAMQATKKEKETEVKEEETVTPQAGEKYEEALSEDGLKPGFYLIANVFGTKKYFDAFMADLRKKSIQPKSFQRSKNQYNYVYLERYNVIKEARKARDSNFDGKYTGNTWILRVVSK